VPSAMRCPPRHRNRPNSDALLKLIELLANRTGALLNVTELSTCTGGTRRTVENHLAILERLFLVRCLPSWHRTATKRLVKSPKVHFVDSALAAMLSGLESGRWLEDRARFGHVLESFVLQQLIPQAGWTDPELRFWHYRDKDQVEVDCVLGLGGAIWAAEIKASRTVVEADTRGLKRLAARAGRDFRDGIVFYDGESILPIAGTPFLAVPVAKLWEQ